jgi:hypothetical protein
MQAVLKPASARPKAARRPDPPAPTTMASYSWSTTGYLLLTKGEASFALSGACVIIRAAARVEEKVLVWVLNAFDNEGLEVNLRIAIEDMLEDLSPDEQQRERT